MMTTVAITVSIVESGLIGGWQPIENLKDKQVTEIAEFAVKTYDDRVPKKHLKLVSVDKGESQIVAGINYNLTITTTEGNANSRGSHQYQAFVYENQFLKKKLISFTPLK
ncbi:Cysteine proteinase inhibitor 5 [Linum grandiflorum]